jgi:hypothetical protein
MRHALQDAPKTGQHTVEDALRDEALSYFFPGETDITCTPTTGEAPATGGWGIPATRRPWPARSSGSGGLSQQQQPQERQYQRQQQGWQEYGNNITCSSCRHLYVTGNTLPANCMTPALHPFA